jgi:hypothetical protein
MMRNRKYDIIQAALAKRGITRYRLTANCGEGWLLPGYIGFWDTEVESGTVVTPDHAYRFWVGWANGDYTLGEEDGSWYELTAENESEDSWQEILQIQQQMRDDPESGKREPLVPPVRESGKPTEREELIIWWWLAPRFFNGYDLTGYEGSTFETFDVQSGGHDLVGSLLPGEVQDISGIVIVAQGTFHFRLSWVWGPENNPFHRYPGHYSLGEKDGGWRPVLREECTEEQWQQLQEAQERLKQIFAQLPAAEYARWTDLAEEEEKAKNEPSPEELRALREQRKGQPRTPRNIRAPKKATDENQSS